MSRETREQLLADVALAMRESQNAGDEFDEVAAARLGINRTDLRCLDILERNGRLTAGRLAELSGLTTGAVTSLVDRLERKGYVRRLRDDEDRRRVFVELTEEARRRAGEIWGPMLADGYGGLDGFTDEELLVIREFLRRGREFISRHIVRVRALADADAPSDRPEDSSRAAS